VIGSSQQLTKIRFSDTTIARDAEAGIDLKFSPIKNEAFFFPVSAQAFDGLHCRVFLTVTHDQQEFISSQPSANVTSPYLHYSKNRCKPLDGLVARKASMPVVDQLKFVQIDSVDRLSGPFSRLFRSMQNPVQAGSKKNRRSFLKQSVVGVGAVGVGVGIGLPPTNLAAQNGPQKLCLANCYLTHDSSGFQLNVTMFHCIETCHRINSPGTT
jgi:hypothetical protein